MSLFPNQGFVLIFVHTTLPSSGRNIAGSRGTVWDFVYGHTHVLSHVVSFWPKLIRLSFIMYTISASFRYAYACFSVAVQWHIPCFIKNYIFAHHMW